MAVRVTKEKHRVGMGLDKCDSCNACYSYVVRLSHYMGCVKLCRRCLRQLGNKAIVMSDPRGDWYIGGREIKNG